MGVIKLTSEIKSIKILINSSGLAHVPPTGSPQAVVGAHGSARFRPVSVGSGICGAACSVHPGLGCARAAPCRAAAAGHAGSAETAEIPDAT